MLIASVPVPDPTAQAEKRRMRRSFSVAEPPSPANLAPGCPFAARCPAAFDPCTVVMPEPVPAHHGGTTRCHLHSAGPALEGRSVVPYLRSVTDDQRSPATTGETSS
jgi:oligopeptide/dipeptide ABC transporter ATP-binding protein